MLNFYPWGLSINIIMPLSISETRVLFKSYVWDESVYLGDNTKGWVLV